ncbi:hypothetical protein P692DRAFT_201842418 [Suillus brevipes Sb2]|nr:hypothetical protein P692DRAFT_201842418 [Suillus brevipes Sb2]
MYEAAREVLMEYKDIEDLPTLYQAKHTVEQLSGVSGMMHNMCFKSCVGFTGQFAHLETCPICGFSCYDQLILAQSSGKKKVTRMQFPTVPIGLQLQAMFCDPQSAVEMQYQEARTWKIFEELEQNEGKVHVYDDFLDGSNYTDTVQEGKIKDTDILYQCKELDCWIAIWKHVLPGVVIPGPRKPQNLDSFLFPGFHHLAAIQQEGLKIWDASHDINYLSFPFLALGTADRPGLAYLNGFIGHHGKNGCCCSHYYPVLLKPHDYNVAGCSHPDINVNDIQGASAEMYWNNLIYVLQSSTKTEYKQCRLETGISKPSIFLGFPPERMRATRHEGIMSLGKDVADTCPYLPGLSIVGTWEFWLFLYGLGPAVLYKCLPNDIWEHFCRLVHAVHIISQHSISHNELCLANRLFLDWSKEFELIYVQRLATHIHFVRQSVHAIDHYGNEVKTKGPLICASQWTMECTIGNLVEEIQQPSNPYANLGQCAIRRAQINALKSIIPSLDTSDTKCLPHFAKDLGSGYALLKCQDRTSCTTTVHEGWAIQDYIERACSDSPILQQFSHDGTIRVCWWARLQLLNGQIAQLAKCNIILSVVSTTPGLSKLLQSLNYSLSLTKNSFDSCIQPLYPANLGDAGTIVVNVKSIHSVVAMVPHKLDD